MFYIEIIFLLFQVKRILPYWLKNPVLVGHSLSEDSKSIDDISDLTDITKKNLKQNEINKLFPIQQAVIPTILNISDSLVFR